MSRELSRNCVLRIAVASVLHLSSWAADGITVAFHLLRLTSDREG